MRLTRNPIKDSQFFLRLDFRELVALNSLAQRAEIRGIREAIVEDLQAVIAAELDPSPLHKGGFEGGLPAVLTGPGGDFVRAWPVVEAQVRANELLGGDPASALSEASR